MDEQIGSFIEKRIWPLEENERLSNENQRLAEKNEIKRGK
jgi:hypothetical protein